MRSALKWSIPICACGNACSTWYRHTSSNTNPLNSSIHPILAVFAPISPKNNIFFVLEVKGVFTIFGARKRQPAVRRTHGIFVVLPVERTIHPERRERRFSTVYHAAVLRELCLSDLRRHVRGSGRHRRSQQDRKNKPFHRNRTTGTILRTRRAPHAQGPRPRSMPDISPPWQCQK